MTLRLVPDADAYVACVLAAGEAQDRRIAAVGAHLPGRPVEPYPGIAEMTPEQRQEAGRKGGLVRRVSDEEYAARASAHAAKVAERSKAIADRRTAVLQFRDDGLSFTAIAKELGISRSAVASIVRRHGVAGQLGTRVPAVFKVNPATGKQIRGFAAMSEEKRRAIWKRATEARKASGLVAPMPVKSVVQHYGLSPREFEVYGVLRTKHGMTQDAAVGAVLRSRRSAPSTGG